MQMLSYAVAGGMPIDVNNGRPDNQNTAVPAQSGRILRAS